MKSCVYLLAGLICLFSCVPDNDLPGKQEANPDFTIIGVPDEPVKAFSTFNLSISSKSPGAIDFKSSAPDLASIVVSGKRQYRVSTKAPGKETEITLTFIQDASGLYPQVTESVQFTLLAEATNSGFTVPDENHPDLAGKKVTFTESTSRILNPERGIYRARDFGSKSSILKASEVKAERTNGHAL